jgi:hypothetical protein
MSMKISPITVNSICTTFARYRCVAQTLLSVIPLKNIGESLEECRALLREKNTYKRQNSICQTGQQNGFHSIWQGESKLARDLINLITVIAAITSKVK